MWICSKCDYKNSNSNKNCHGVNCNANKEKNGIIELREIPKQKKTVKRVLDYCPVCKKDMFFTPAKWEGKVGYWSCESHSHRVMELTGRTKPIASYLPKVNI